MFFALTSCTQCLKKDKKKLTWIYEFINPSAFIGLFNKFYADKNHSLCQFNLYFWIFMLLNITFYSLCKSCMKTTEVCMYSLFIVHLQSYQFSFLSQFVGDFFRFLIVLHYERATVAFRASLVLIHAIFGSTKFMLAVDTCLTGLTEEAIFELGYVMIQHALAFSVG